MKTLRIYLIGLLTISLGFAAGCGDDDNPVVINDTDSDTSDGGDGPSTGGEELNITPDLTNCGSAGTTTCEDMITAANPDACVANFGYGSNQVGKVVNGAFEAGQTIGFYGYNDKTPGASMIPVPNDEGTEPATFMRSCDPQNQYVMRLKVSGYTTWGAGVGMDWGGPNNENCDESLHPGVSACLQIGLDDNKFKLDQAMADPKCKGSTPQETDAFIHCLKYGKVMKEMRDLSAYKGIGFWMLAVDDGGDNQNMAASVKVTFPIPETARFLWELDPTVSEGCIEDVEGSECFNDFATTVQVSLDSNVWEYKTVLFDDLAFADSWGYKAKQYASFPSQRSIGIKFQIDKVGASAESDLLIDDIVLLPK